ncbi:Swt1 family HEPN domain-containing protein [Winogradskyella ouciana]|uniref:Swt1-like HEPN domain-containing protein n=1 Tax=Winogradskyella ouciana TaxID=2608631 RepID=A0A7K1GDY1_9FLAO|nr:Swt1 family HEPN domain-containing protein [Winogradskyella ouciana]MTE26049.1 hypothetical protein [Winogradskyella ouciana]
MKDDPLYSFAFRGLLTKQALESTEANDCSKLEVEEEKLNKLLCIDELEVDFVVKAKRMSFVYVAICAFENMVRDFVTKVLLEEKGTNWWNDCVKKRIRDKALKRKEEEDKIRWHTQRGDDYINYTEFGDLVSIMMGDNWEFFEPHIISLEWAQQIIKTLERSRNVIMHSGELSEQDLARIGTYIRDWVRQVGA